jgi:hypothetical protein
MQSISRKSAWPAAAIIRIAATCNDGCFAGLKWG